VFNRWVESEERRTDLFAEQLLVAVMRMARCITIGMM